MAATQIQHSDYMMHKQSILKFVGPGGEALVFNCVHSWS